jgi:hypothetical protein
MPRDVLHQFQAPQLLTKSIDERVIRVIETGAAFVTRCGDFDGAGFDKPKPSDERVCRPAILVEPRGQTYRIVELESKSFELSEWRNLVTRSDCLSYRPRTQRDGQAVQGKFVRRFWRQLKKDRAKN